MGVRERAISNRLLMDVCHYLCERYLKCCSFLSDEHCSTQSAQVKDVALAVNGFGTLCLTEVGSYARKRWPWPRWRNVSEGENIVLVAYYMDSRIVRNPCRTVKYHETHAVGGYS